MYHEFAQVYDRLMDQVDYDSWAEGYRKMLLEAGVKTGGRVLEGACGTGAMSLRLARHFELLPCDISPRMLQIAMDKARKEGLKLPFVKMDLRRLTSHKQVDAVLAACDGVNYLLTLTDLRRFLRSAYAILKPGGALAFDLSSHYKLQTLLGNQPQVRDHEDIAVLWQNSWDSKGCKLSLSLSVFCKREDGCFDRLREEQVQRAYQQDTVQAELLRAGYEKIRMYGDWPLKKPVRTSQRLHFVANKPKG